MEYLWSTSVNLLFEGMLTSYLVHCFFGIIHMVTLTTLGHFFNLSHFWAIFNFQNLVH